MVNYSSRSLQFCFILFAVSTRIFVPQLGFWNMLCWSHHYRSSEWSSLWTRGSLLCEPICSTCNSFPFLFRLPRTWHFISNSAVVSRKAKDGYPSDAPGPCSHIFFFAEFELLFAFVSLYMIFSSFHVLCCVCISPFLFFILGLL